MVNEILVFVINSYYFVFCFLKIKLNCENGGKMSLSIKVSQEVQNDNYELWHLYSTLEAAAVRVNAHKDRQKDIN